MWAVLLSYTKAMITGQASLYGMHFLPEDGGRFFLAAWKIRPLPNVWQAEENATEIDTEVRWLKSSH